MLFLLESLISQTYLRKLRFPLARSISFSHLKIRFLQNSNEAKVRCIQRTLSTEICVENPWIPSCSNARNERSLPVHPAMSRSRCSDSFSLIVFRPPSWPLSRTRPCRQHKLEGTAGYQPMISGQSCWQNCDRVSSISLLLLLKFPDCV